MAAPSGTSWGSIAGGYGRVGIHVALTNANAKTEVTISTWFWSKYSVSDSNNHYYYNNNATAATTEVEIPAITTTHNSGSGWSTTNQVKLGESTYTYDRGTSDVTRNCAVKLTNIDMVGAAMTHTVSYTIPALDSYSVAYNANGGSGAPSKQTKWYGMAMPLSSTKPTRDGYVFQGWSTANDTIVEYDPGDSYTANAAVTLYAVWEANTYAVKYDTNGGSGGPSSQTKTYGIALTLSSDEPTRTNYRFLGWGTSATATTVSYEAGDKYTANAAITLYAVWELAYTKPKITKFNVQRYDGTTGTVSETGTSAQVELGWSTFHEVSDITISWTSASSGSGSKSVSASGISGNSIEIIGNDALSTDASYTVTVTISDSGGSNSSSRTLAGTKYVVDVRAGGTGISFGKPAELANTMDVAYSARFREDIQLDDTKSIQVDFSPNGNPDNVIKMNIFTPRDVNGDTSVGFANYDIGRGNTYVYGNDVYVATKAADPAKGVNYRPYIRQGDSIKIAVKTAGYVTNAGKDVTFFVPLSRPVVGDPTITVSSVDGFILRQAGKYTHGSTAETFTVPDSYTVSDYYDGGIMITAVFSNTTDASNNDAIGIYWSGNITFSYS